MNDLEKIIIKKINPENPPIKPNLNRDCIVSSLISKLSCQGREENVHNAKLRTKKINKRSKFVWFW
jgi:hypothetical protein